MYSPIKIALFSLAIACAPMLMDAAQLRICADPNNLPYSNNQQQGFENKIADLIAKDLGFELTYFWFPQREAFFRKTLNAGVCDVVMGVPSSFDEAEVHASVLPLDLCFYNAKRSSHRNQLLR